MKATINSRKLNQEVTFTRPETRYIYVDLNGKPGTLGNQICSGGRLTGSTISYCGDSSKAFATICRSWFNSYLRSE